MCRLDISNLDDRIYPTTAMVQGLITQEQYIEGLVEYIVKEWFYGRRCDSVVMEYLFGEAVHRVREKEKAEAIRMGNDPDFYEPDRQTG